MPTFTKCRYWTEPSFRFLASVLDRAYREDQIKISGTDSDGKPVYGHAE